MPTPTDRGFAFVTSTPEGTTVRVAVDSDGETPRGVYAEHVGAAAIDIAPGVRVARRGALTYTLETVEVFGDDAGVVHISKAGATSLAL